MAYTAFDLFVAKCRFNVAFPHIRQGTRVCDIGCGYNPRCLQWLGRHIRLGVGLDHQVRGDTNGVPFVVTDITQGLPVKDSQFDHVMMLAVLEHLGEPQFVLREAHRILAAGGSLIVTWPQSVVDPILALLHRLRLVSDEMESEQHKPRVPLDKLKAMLHEIGFKQISHRTFEFGLNNLLVAHKKD